MFTARAAHWHAPIAAVVLLISGAAFLQDPLFGDAGGLVDDLCLEAVRRAARRHRNTPLLVPLLVGDLPRGRHEHIVLLDLLADMWPLQVIIDHHFLQLTEHRNGRKNED